MKTKAQRAPRRGGAEKVSVEVGMGRLAFEALACVGEKRRQEPSSRVESAIRFYLSDRESGRVAWLFPAPLRGEQAPGEVELTLSVDGDLWHSFEVEVGRQDVSLRQLLDHAAFYLLAEIGSGRITQRILDDLESGPAQGEAG